MKNNENRDQMIRETFDQCLSGIDELPSLRPDILRKAGTQSPARKPVPFRRYAVPAAMALLLCGGILGVNGLWSNGGREDQIRNDAGDDLGGKLDLFRTERRSRYLDHIVGKLGLRLVKVLFIFIDRLYPAAAWDPDEIGLPCLALDCGRSSG